jgi:metal-dependent hydrolase (beta-lactamase superfamily II)
MIFATFSALLRMYIFLFSKMHVKPVCVVVRVTFWLAKRRERFAFLRCGVCMSSSQPRALREKNGTQKILFEKFFVHEIDACHCVGNKQNQLLRKMSRELSTDF